MMDFKELEKELRQEICKELIFDYSVEGKVRINTPYLYEDGDHIYLALKKSGDSYIFSDEGRTLFELTYDDINLELPTRTKILNDNLIYFKVVNDDGELKTEVIGNNFSKAFYNLLQCCMRIYDMIYLTRENVKTLFLEDICE